MSRDSTMTTSQIWGFKFMEGEVVTSAFYALDNIVNFQIELEVTRHFPLAVCWVMTLGYLIMTSSFQRFY
jgi:hypothetical protein